jgi:hypothetical protein
MVVVIDCRLSHGQFLPKITSLQRSTGFLPQLVNSAEEHRSTSPARIGRHPVSRTPSFLLWVNLVALNARRSLPVYVLRHPVTHLQGTSVAGSRPGMKERIDRHKDGSI